MLRGQYFIRSRTVVSSLRELACRTVLPAIRERQRSHRNPAEAGIWLIDHEGLKTELAWVWWCEYLAQGCLSDDDSASAASRTCLYEPSTLHNKPPRHLCAAAASEWISEWIELMRKLCQRIKIRFVELGCLVPRFIICHFANTVTSNYY